MNYYRLFIRSGLSGKDIRMEVGVTSPDPLGHRLIFLQNSPRHMLGFVERLTPFNRAGTFLPVAWTHEGEEIELAKMSRLLDGVMEVLQYLSDHQDPHLDLESYEKDQ